MRFLYWVFGIEKKIKNYEQETKWMESSTARDLVIYLEQQGGFITPAVGNKAVLTILKKLVEGEK